MNNEKELDIGTCGECRFFKNPGDEWGLCLNFKVNPNSLITNADFSPRKALENWQAFRLLARMLRNFETCFNPSPFIEELRKFKSQT